jgi:hypothetical protein
MSFLPDVEGNVLDHCVPAVNKFFGDFAIVNYGDFL